MRRRACLAGAVVATVAAGLASRKWPWLLPAALGKYPGDVFWAQAVYWGIGFLAPSASLARVAAYALTIAYADELSQLYQAPWINQVRATPVGHLVLGAVFAWGDLLAYTVGVGLCGALEVLLRKLGHGRPGWTNRRRPPGAADT